MFIAFLIPFTDLGISQSPMLQAAPATWAHFLPGYGAEQIVMNGILAPSFDEPRSLLIALAWLAVLTTAAVMQFWRTSRTARRNLSARDTTRSYVASPRLGKMPGLSAPRRGNQLP